MTRWPSAPVAALVDLQNGYPFDSELFSSDADTPLVRIRDLMAVDFETFVPASSVPSSVVLRDGDVVVGMDGDFSVVRWTRGPAALNQRLCRLRGRQGSDVRFVEYALPEPLRAIHETQFATTVKHLSSSEVLSSRVPYPAIAVQRRIADFLDDQVVRIDAVVDARKRQLRGLAEQRDSAVHRAVTGASVAGPRVTSHLPWALALPESWREPRICQVATMGTGHTPSRSEPEYWVDCDIPWLTTGDVHRFRHDEIDVITDTTLHISGLGLANSAAVLHPAGTVALSRTASAGFPIEMGRPMATSQDFATWTPGPLLRPRYLLWSLRTMRADIMGRLAIGSTHKTIYFPDLMSIRIPLPPLEAQDDAIAAIVAVVRDYEALGGGIARSIELLAEYKRSLITAAVSGEFDVSTAGGRAPSF